MLLLFKASVYNPGELATSESGTSSEFPPRSRQRSVQSHKLEHASVRGTQQEKELLEQDAAIS